MPIPPAPHHVAQHQGAVLERYAGHVVRTGSHAPTDDDLAYRSAAVALAHALPFPVSFGIRAARGTNCHIVAEAPGDDRRAVAPGRPLCGAAGDWAPYGPWPTCGRCLQRAYALLEDMSVR